MLWECNWSHLGMQLVTLRKLCTPFIVLSAIVGLAHCQKLWREWGRKN